MHGEKGKGKLRKNAMCCFQQILEATLHKTAAVQLLTSHLKNYNQVRQTSHAEEARMNSIPTFF